MASSDRNLGSAVGAKSARACDNCVRKRARWYCAADDAFLCQSCDSSVHSANPLARRHERVRLKIASINSFDDESRSKLRISVPSWHQGFTRKARTPRQKKQAKFSSDEAGGGISHPLHLVPELSGEEHSNEENEEQLLYRVPIFDPFVAELCTSVNSNEAGNTIPNDAEIMQGVGLESNPASNDVTGHVHGFLPSEMDLAEFAADVESLLGTGLDDESFDMEGLGILNGDDERERECSLGSRVKVKDEEIGEVVNHHADVEFIGLERETFELNFDYDSPITGEDEDNKVVEPIMVNNFDGSNTVQSSRNIFLRLDYEGVMSAWDDKKSPWTTGERPDLNPDDCWPDCMGTCGTMHVYGDTGTMGGHAAAMANGGREARVSRYREKRRTRLFSKKIRYEVRKLNAEKRPRMKGRFVKRANFVAQPFNLINK